MTTLRNEFKDSEYRHAYAESFANTIIATQIRLLRGSMTQEEFAALVGMKQSRISAMEDENYSSWATKTLKQIAARNDVVFLGRFVSFGEMLDWSRRLSEGALKVVPFSADPVFAQPPQSTITASANVIDFNTRLRRGGTAAAGLGELISPRSSQVPLNVLSIENTSAAVGYRMVRNG